MPLSAAVDCVLLPRRSMEPYSATLVVLVSATLWLVGAFTLVGFVPGSGFFPVTSAHKITVPQAGDPIISRGNPHLPEITLTFDDGPNPPYTSKVLAILKRFGIQVTFFCIGRQVAAYPEIVQQEFAAGNMIGNHTWSHPPLPALSVPQIRAQLTMTSDIVQRITGVRPRFFRPPYGALSAQVLAQVNQLGLTTVLWSVDPRDWSLPGVNVIIGRVLSQTGDGAIILMHDGGGNRSQTVAALPIIIETLQERGFHFVTLQRLVADLSTSTLALAAGANRPRGPAPTLESALLFAADASVRSRSPVALVSMGIMPGVSEERRSSLAERG